MIFFDYYWLSKGSFGQRDLNFDDFMKTGYSSLLKITAFWNTSYDVINTGTWLHQ